MKQRQKNFVQAAIASFQRLQQRRKELQAEIEEIDGALEQMGGMKPVPAARRVQGTATTRKRAGNSMSIREAALKALSNGAKSRQDLLAAVQKLGYQFSAVDPMNSLQAFLYGPGKKLFTRRDGMFALAAGTSSVPANGRSEKAGRRKRTMSAAARKKIAAAQKARWAKVKAGKKRE